MENQPPVLAQSSRNKRVILIALGIVSLVVAFALVGGWLFLRFSRHNMAGLEGTWSDPKNAGHHYEFQPNGSVDTWSGQKAWWKKIGWSATWRRDGKQITIRTDRNWDFVGELGEGTIRGKMNIRDEAGANAITTEMVWQKE
jgi:hypothetical protein